MDIYERQEKILETMEIRLVNLSSKNYVSTINQLDELTDGKMLDGYRIYPIASSNTDKIAEFYQTEFYSDFCDELPTWYNHIENLDNGLYELAKLYNDKEELMELSDEEFIEELHSDLAMKGGC